MKKYFLTCLLFCFITTLSFSIEKLKTDQFVFVDGGTFQMGDESSKVHSVTLYSFYISKYELTQEKWTEVMGYNPSICKGSKNPVDNISFYEAIEFCNKKSQIDGLEEVYSIDKENKDPSNQHNSDNLKWSITCNWNANGYRLPTEAEWEFAAKGGNKTRNYNFSGSDNINTVSWYIENSNKQTKPVGKKKPNELGLYDMSGNVWERCWDWYESYANLPVINPRGPEGGYSKVYRGGGAGYQKGFHTTTIRRELPGIRKNQNMGMRLAKSKGKIIEKNEDNINFNDTKYHFNVGLRTRVFDEGETISIAYWFNELNQQDKQNIKIIHYLQNEQIYKTESSFKDVFYKEENEINKYGFFYQEYYKNYDLLENKLSLILYTKDNRKYIYNNFNISVIKGNLNIPEIEKNHILKQKKYNFSLQGINETNYNYYFEIYGPEFNNDGECIYHQKINSNTIEIDLLNYKKAEYSFCLSKHDPLNDYNFYSREYSIRID